MSRPAAGPLLAALLFAALVLAVGLALVLVEGERDEPPLVESKGTEPAASTAGSRR